MPAATFDLAIARCTSDQSIETLVSELLAILDKQGDPYLEYKISEALLFEHSSTTILEGLKREEREYYQRRFLELQVEAELCASSAKAQVDTLDHSSTGNQEPAVYTCPACQHQQTIRAEGMTICERCEVAGETSVFQHQSPLKSGQTRLVKGALDRVRYAEDVEAGTEKKLSLLDVLVGATVVALMSISVFFIVQTLTDGEMTDQETVRASVGVAGNKGTVMQPPPQSPSPVKMEVLKSSATAITRLPLPATQNTQPQQALFTTNTHSSADTDWGEIKLLLQASVSRNTYFQKASKAQLSQEQIRLQRLLALGKPELAIVFAQGQDDAYLAALLELKIIQAGVGKRNRVQEGDIVHHLKGVLLRLGHTEQGVLVTGNLSQIYRLLGETGKADNALKQAFAMAVSTHFIPSQQLSLLLQLANDHHQFGQHEIAHQILARAEQLAASLPLADRQQLLADLQMHEH